MNCPSHFGELTPHTLFFGILLPIFRNLNISSDDEWGAKQDGTNKEIISGLNCKVWVQFENYDDFNSAMQALCGRSLEKVRFSYSVTSYLSILNFLLVHITHINDIVSIPSRFFFLKSISSRFSFLVSFYIGFLFQLCSSVLALPTGNYHALTLHSTHPSDLHMPF